MGDIVIRMRGNARTGEKEVVVEYESDDDLTRVEHEQRHREIVELLIKQGVVTREESAGIVFAERGSGPAQGEQTAEGQA